MTRHNSQSVREKRDPSVYFTFRQNGDFITLQLPTHVYLFTMSDNKYSLQFQNLEWLAPHAQVLRLFPSLLWPLKIENVEFVSCHVAPKTWK